MDFPVKLKEKHSFKKAAPVKSGWQISLFIILKLQTGIMYFAFRSSRFFNFERGKYSRPLWSSVFPYK